MTIEKSVTLLDKMSLLVEQGTYRSSEEMVQDALRALLRTRPDLRVRLAIEMYKKEEASLSRAAEVAGMDFESFKEALADAGVVRQLTPSGEFFAEQMEHFEEFLTNDRAQSRP